MISFGSIKNGVLRSLAKLKMTTPTQEQNTKFSLSF